MAAIDHLMSALDERQIAQRVALPHDNARMRFPLTSNTVSDFDEFSDGIGAYYNFHLQAVTNGASLPRSEAVGRAKEILEQQYRRRNGDIVAAFNDAHDGTNGGMRVLLDTIAEGLKYEFIERYIRELFDRIIAPNAWEMKVEIIRQFIQRCGAYLATTIETDRPERYAHNYQELIRSYVDSMRDTSSIFRRL